MTAATLFCWCLRHTGDLIDVFIVRSQFFCKMCNVSSVFFLKRKGGEDGVRCRRTDFGVQHLALRKYQTIRRHEQRDRQRNKKRRNSSSNETMRDSTSLLYISTSLLYTMCQLSRIFGFWVGIWMYRPQQHFQPSYRAI